MFLRLLAAALCALAASADPSEHILTSQEAVQCLYSTALIFRAHSDTTLVSDDSRALRLNDAAYVRPMALAVARRELDAGIIRRFRFKEMQKADLVTECEARGLSTEGGNMDLRRRLSPDDDGVEGGEPDHYDVMERDDLVDECLARGIPSDGNRMELRARLRLQDAEDDE